MPPARLTRLPLVLAVAGTFLLPSVASATGHGTPPAACTKDTQEVTNLTTVTTDLGTALRAAPPDPTRLSQLAGDLFTAVTAAQTADCLPPLPTSPTRAPTPPTARPQDTTACAADTVNLLSATLGQISAGIAAPPDATAVLAAANKLATAITAVNTDSCLPVTLPVPPVPAPPAPPVS
jgi:hypothetical protein